LPRARLNWACPDTNRDTPVPNLTGHRPLSELHRYSFPFPLMEKEKVRNR